MNPSAWTVAVAIVVLGIALIISTYRRGPRAAHANRFARSVGLLLPDTLRSVVTERVNRRHRGGAAGMIVGIAATAFVLAADRASSANFASPFILVGGAFAGLAVGAAVTAAATAAPLDPNAVKYARTSAVQLDDYVAPIERVGARIVVGLAVVALAIGMATGVAPNLALVGLGLLAVATLVFFEVVGRRIVERAQPAGSPDELAWDDAVRASVLRDIVTGPITLGAFAFVVGFGAIAERMTGFANTAVLAAVLLAAIAVAIASIVSRPQRYFLKRLWPEVKAA